MAFEMSAPSGGCRPDHWYPALAAARCQYIDSGRHGVACLLVGSPVWATGKGVLVLSRNPGGARLGSMRYGLGGLLLPAADGNHTLCYRRAECPAGRGRLPR